MSLVYLQYIYHCTIFMIFVNKKESLHYKDNIISYWAQKLFISRWIRTAVLTYCMKTRLSALCTHSLQVHRYSVLLATMDDQRVDIALCARKKESCALCGPVQPSRPWFSTTITPAFYVVGSYGSLSGLVPTLSHPSPSHTSHPLTPFTLSHPSPSHTPTHPTLSHPQHSSCVAESWG